MRMTILLAFVILLNSCASFEKKHFKAVKFFNENEVLGAKYCSEKFPSTERFIKGEPITTTDTLYIDVPFKVDCDSVKGKVVTITKRVPCEQKTIKITDTIVIVDKAKERVLIGEIDKNREMFVKEKLRAEIAEKSASKANKVLVLLTSLIVGYVIFKIVRK